MKRRIFNAIAVLSAVLCVGTVVLWVRGFTAFDVLFWCSPKTNVTYYAGHRDGRCWLGWRQRAMADEPGFSYFSMRRTASSKIPEGSHREFAGVHWAGRSNPSIPELYLAVPALYVVVLLALLPIWAVYRRVQTRQFSQGRCRNCGYDLRATPDRCPECGAVPEKLGASQS